MKIDYIEIYSEEQGIGRISFGKLLREYERDCKYINIAREIAKAYKENLFYFTGKYLYRYYFPSQFEKDVIVKHYMNLYPEEFVV